MRKRNGLRVVKGSILGPVKLNAWWIIVINLLVDQNRRRGLWRTLLPDLYGSIVVSSLQELIANVALFVLFWKRDNLVAGIGTSALTVLMAPCTRDTFLAAKTKWFKANISKEPGEGCAC